MKLVSRIRGDKAQRTFGDDTGPRSSYQTPAVASAIASATRDRSRSLCVEQLGLATLLHPAFEPATRNLRTIHSVQRRRASSAV
ncbi:hypothetical protein V9T40_009893 [Parthenolecanium corni]|uniref:Uncharacterized protein n=1 Tax=Parthenolecanium corni TaxID=536013 RepID=A0AAN9TJV7_9HEMI